jgi:uncharacterized membrane protein YdbT with pleckstrin-like domain
MPARRYRLKGFDRYLAPSEHILHTTRRHWIVIAKPVAIWLLILLIGGFLGFATSPEQTRTLIDRIVGIVALVATIYAVWKVAQWIAAAYVITDQRVLEIEGLFARKVSAVPLMKVTDTTFRRTVPGRILGYGDLMLDSPGEKPGLSTLTVLPRPVELYRMIMSLVVTKDEREPATPLAPPPMRKPDEDETGPIQKVST